MSRSTKRTRQDVKREAVEDVEDEDQGDNYAGVAAAAAAIAADAEENEGFDYASLFEECSQMVPELTEIIKYATKFGDPHRYVLQNMIIEPSVTLKKFNILFITYVATVKLERSPSVVKYIKANAMQLRDLAKAVVKTINEAKQSGYDGNDPQVAHDMGMRLVILSEESTPKEWVSLAGEIQNSEVVGESSEMSKAERTLFLAIIDEMLQNNGKVKRNWILANALKLKMTNLKCEKFLTSLVEGKWLFENELSDYIEMSPRTVAEMDPYIRAKFVNSVHICQLCRRIIAKSVFSAECTKCNLFMHFNCFQNAAEFTNSDGVECKNCDAKISLEKVKKDIKENLRNPRVVRRAQTPPAGHSDEEMVEEQQQEEQEEEGAGPDVEDLHDAMENQTIADDSE